MFFEFGCLWVHVEPTLRLLRWEWKETVSSEDFQVAFKSLLAYSNSHQVKNWLADISHMPSVGTDEQAWLSETWLEQFAALGIEHIAFIQPVNLHNQLVLESVLTDGRRYLRTEVQFFSDILAALDWLTPSPCQAEHLEQQWKEVKRCLPRYE
ncbi:STAS/SEC14 domain-containing protein [Hymenobacter sp. HSC-4F20]|uniref:STAS/SEC14 domain-containing protein n=1 Tax=Hymenobacter sp. HSC-4F20 TaxID=2864135 RepID=UPI001C73AF80|nr:STAS/SEC14 domain-containing protein [Hymenobacter sp. HSC-4F20]MBX0292704.1 STAS/SEC14 domain-containing protein [Hymenobacter sp. HSC-4F20]